MVTIGWRVLTASALAYPVVQGAVLFGLALPIDHANAALTGGSLGLLMVVALVSWIAGAQKILQILASLFLPGALLTALLLTLSR